MAKRTKAELEAEAFRARIMELRGLWDTDWKDWEADWLDSEARRPPHYVASEKEWKIVRRLMACTTTFSSYNGFSVPEMIAITMRHLRDLDDDGEEFVKNLAKSVGRTLRVRQISRLAAICRMTELIGTDEDVEAALLATRHNDDDSDKIEELRRSA